MSRYVPLIAMLAALSAIPTAFAAANADPDWPCIQRKVPEISIGQVWNGDELPETAKQWDRDPRVSDLAAELVKRSNPIENARKQVSDYAATLPKEQVHEKLEQLFMGVFDKINIERGQIISGIARYAEKQRQLAADVRKKAAEIDRMRAAADTDQAELARHDQQLTWETRIFEERVQSLTYVCEVPTLIEQRLYSISKIIDETMQKN
ncbi:MULTISPECIES: hypothetical protein [Rhizobium/Agrobacterium group]|uniref:Uncharacterized protein n=2 Tax=Neorhizobium TaxID=1525371 RepID=A0ABV0M217_9HYPH|nr:MULTISPECIES: hypothetical protein [Rhizobium/Agrobacterium group]KGD96544.1 hypothetical protein JL39_18285 [Rhizobium sp. YS-1r]MCC2611980.1 hypothetical protein [Neorhizobium petrolearium]WGI67141.1 hypothetical protein QEO92_19300 [Neorhizobium petrolearium]